MGILSSLFAAVSGLNATGSVISIIGDNIANTNTVGFKSSRGEFVDLLSGNLSGGGGSGQIGAGSRLFAVSVNFTQGTLESTGVNTDLAVDGGGFFIVQDTNGVFYTRAGGFRLDANQILVNAQGQVVQGFGVTPAGVPNGALGTIDLSTVSSTPTSTANVNVNVNLDPNQLIPAAFDQTNPVSTSNFQTGIRVFDSLGNARNVLIYFRKDASVAAGPGALPIRTRWQYFAGAAASELDSSVVPAAAQPEDFVVQQWGSLEFDQTGALQRHIPADLDGDLVADTFDYDLDTVGEAHTGFTFNSAVPNQLMSFDYGSPEFDNSAVPVATGNPGVDQTTQFGGVAASGVNNFVRFMNQDGFSAGSLNSLEIDEDGFVTGLFSNGVTQRLHQIALANFPNIRGLSRAGDNNFVETSAAGNPVIGSPNQSGFGAIRSSFLELSNTELAGEFVKLILAQRAFQANTRTVTTTNELLANLVFLGQ